MLRDFGSRDTEFIQIVQEIRDELLAVVFLYRALGGGWQGTPAEDEPIAPAEADDQPVDEAAPTDGDAAVADGSEI